MKGGPLARQVLSSPYAVCTRAFEELLKRDAFVEWGHDVLPGDADSARKSFDAVGTRQPARVERLSWRRRVLRKDGGRLRRVRSGAGGLY